MSSVYFLMGFISAFMFSDHDYSPLNITIFTVTLIIAIIDTVRVK